jgi:hypothetical protein
MRTALFVVLATTVAGLALVECSGVSLCDGSYALGVRVVSASGVPLEAVNCEVLSHATDALSDPSQAEQVLASPDFRERSPSGLGWQVTARPYVGEELAVSVWFTDRVSVLLGRQLGFSQARALVVAVEYRDGKRAGKVVEIPDRAAARSVMVTVP